jgi:hypothetical protein
MNGNVVLKIIRFVRLLTFLGYHRGSFNWLFDGLEEVWGNL